MPSSPRPSRLVALALLMGALPATSAYCVDGSSDGEVIVALDRTAPINSWLATGFTVVDISES